jgi:hypothetical protein
MRQNLLPILEAGGVDLVLCGHSHCYERSYLLDGHYGLSGTLTPAMKKNAGDGRPAGNGAYIKPLTGVRSHLGAVYAVAGSAGKISGGSLDHPAHFISLNNLGSLVLDVNGTRLDATFLRENSSIPDSFSIIKQDPNQPPTVAITSPANNASVISTFTIAATAADSDGTIASVKFYDGTTLLNTDTSSPYSFAWSGAALGSHVLTAVALDNGGLTTTSAVINVTVLPSAGFSGLTASQSITAGTASVTLGGTVGGTGPVYPAAGETVVVALNGVTQNATISGSAGTFTLSFPTATIPVSTTPYPITYSYAGNGTTLNPATDDASTTLTVVDPFAAWISTQYPSLVGPAALPGADPDGDGDNNLVEFALNGNPSAAAASGKVRSRIGSVGGDQVLLLTLPVRGTPTFAGLLAQTATVDQVVYTIEGSNGLTVFDQAVTELSPVRADGMPALDSGWGYRTFRLNGMIGGATPRGPQGFLRIGITAVP